ncbi:MAG: DUF1538 domain-containing protein [Euryarchaeota archaeon]|nr:DUF1538 domain-containing protein [Euryarchaeota archaeon]MBU4608841.1 DUF1538 domain-containing protein [Euryarchaeota archaeon]MBV1729272.1 DUF1538 domain-containing protein [Methanobacterium sp.]MBV1755778.1 DUF1538 domain-containing protein [Methanobacterium sp.]
MYLEDLKREFKATLRSLSPAIILILIFQVFLIKMPWMEFLQVGMGLLSTILGFTLFVQGAKKGLLPLGENMGSSFIEKRAFIMIMLFGFLLGLTLTLAEPDVRLVAFQITQITLLNISQNELIYVTALGLGFFTTLAILRSMVDFPIIYILIPGYGAAIVLSILTADEFIAKAFDLGAVTTGPMTVPFLIAIGVGIASVLGGRDRLESGFGIMAIGSIGPVLAILIWSLIRGGI